MIFPNERIIWDNVGATNGRPYNVTDFTANEGIYYETDRLLDHQE